MAKKFSLELPVTTGRKKAAAEPPPQQEPFQGGDSEDYDDEEEGSEGSLSSGAVSSDLDLDQGPGSSQSQEDDEGDEGEDEEEDDLGIVDDEFELDDVDAGQGGSKPSSSKRSGAAGRAAARAEGEAGSGSEGEGDDEGFSSLDDDEDDDEGEDVEMAGDDSADASGDEGEEGGSGSAGEETAAPSKAKSSKFTEGGKGAPFAKAFAKILQRPVKGLDGSKSAAAAAPQAAAEAGEAKVVLRGAVGDSAILAESKTHSKRQAEEAEATAASRAAKKARMEARRRGRLPVPRRGQDPASDLREKSLQKLATKGVVLLFNAVTKAQRAQQEAAASGSKAPAKAAKASFLAQLQAGSGAVSMGGLPSLGAAAKPGQGMLGLSGPGSKAAGGDQPSEDAPGWKVLQDSFTGLAGSGKMKDWDKELSDEGGDGMAANSDSDAGDDEGW